MSTDEPAWRAEIESMARALIRGAGNMDELLDAAGGHIEAARKAGRREALRRVIAELNACIAPANARPKIPYHVGPLPYRRYRP